MVERFYYKVEEITSHKAERSVVRLADYVIKVEISGEVGEIMSYGLGSAPRIGTWWSPTA